MRNSMRHIHVHAVYSFVQSYYGSDVHHREQALVETIEIRARVRRRGRPWPRRRGRPRRSRSRGRVGRSRRRCYGCRGRPSRHNLRRRKSRTRRRPNRRRRSLRLLLLRGSRHTYLPCHETARAAGRGREREEQDKGTGAHDCFSVPHSFDVDRNHSCSSKYFRTSA